MADPKREPDDEEQSKRFIKKAREVAGEDADDVFERAVKTVMPPRAPAKQKRDD